MEEMKIKKCLMCKKTLLDEKVPICLRCRLSGRDKSVKAGTGLVAGLYSAYQIYNLIGNNGKTDDDV